MILGAPCGHFLGDVVDNDADLKRYVYLDMELSIYSFLNVNILSDMNKVLKDGIDVYNGVSPVTVVNDDEKDATVYFYPNDMLDEVYKDPSADMLLDRATTISVAWPYDRGGKFAEPFFRGNFLRDGIKTPEKCDFPQRSFA